MALIDDWLAYVEKPDRFDKHHFGGLMLELETPTLLHRALDPLPNGSAVADRIAKFRERADFNGTYLLARPQGISAAARRLAEAYRDGVCDRLRELNDSEAAFIRNSPVEEISVESYRRLRQEGALRLLNATMTLEFCEKESTRAFPEWKRGLREAIYMMTTIPEVTRYLLWPIFRYPLDDTPAAELWLMGHRIDFCEDRTLLIVGGAG